MVNLKQDIKSKSEEVYAVIFSSVRADLSDANYELEAQKMMDLVRTQNGYLGSESYRNNDGSGVTISYWNSREAIKNWKLNVEHSHAQQNGKTKWYKNYRIKICKVEREYEFPF